MAALSIIAPACSYHVGSVEYQYMSDSSIQSGPVSQTSGVSVRQPADLTPGVTTDEVVPSAITADIPLKTLAERFPFAAEVLALEYGLHCLTCAAQGIDTLERGARLHGMTDADIAELVADLNERLADQ